MTERQALIDQFRAGGAVLNSAIEGLREGELDCREGAGEWSVRQIVHHVADGEIVRAARLFRLLVEDEPVIDGIDEGAYLRALHYERGIDASVAMFHAVRESLAALLEELSAEEWRRVGRHSEFDSFGVEVVVERGVAHVVEHVDQIRRARSRWVAAG